MLKQYTNSNWLKEIKKTLLLSQIQRDVLIGTVLGDGSLKISRSGKAAQLQICHSFSAKEYVYWKQEIFANWIFCEPRYYQINNSLIFRTVSHPLIFEYMQMFYINKVKIIPKNISNILTSPFSLAVWFMDDGNGYLDRGAYRISTYAFGLEGNLLLQNCLKENFGLEVRLHKDSKGYQLYIPYGNGSATKFRKLIAPYIIPKMKYKIERRSPVET
ncbi:MAG: LAGLIDADG homing endonuclease [Candidatus Daviesbacteria bacterium GW2011_GWA2_38_24]|uniref:LAGLIDADG homing endonuclease n=1 Tax=Candidatus Daviesbacteria bacterium GW2011_GWA2_38_24 TaxID=1618422 RepID=A0A0G0LVU5_9BACT|nr:MAG: LAGLIDADG homing endonuclease [Candidatus Daviesbacteria bacterium GW2011_GWA2_38_24]KKQ78545.1 MAG: LAGLIDADG homing endonuclease [Candidatus Daviesbacteria bacterium GW2011_GWA1_38_7]